MNDSTQNTRGHLIWTEDCSVGVKEIDDQHKHLFGTINDLIKAISSTPNEEEVKRIIYQVLEYKSLHFATEEKYFHLFNYEGTEAHEAAHRSFEKRIEEMKEKNKDDIVALAFELVDFLEDWLIGHTLNEDKKYAKCFHDHGLR